MNIEEMKVTDMPDSILRGVTEDIGMRFNGIVTVLNYWTEHCVKYISFANAGGIIAILTFMNLKNIKSLLLPGLALVLFVIGLVLVGFLIAHMFYRMKTNRDKMITYADKFYEGNIKWGEFKEIADKAKKFSRPALILGWSSASCFYLGIIIGIISFIKYVR